MPVWKAGLAQVNEQRIFSLPLRRRRRVGFIACATSFQPERRFCVLHLSVVTVWGYVPQHENRDCVGSAGNSVGRASTLTAHVTRYETDHRDTAKYDGPEQSNVEGPIRPVDGREKFRRHT
jgi:hypothetical protein